MKRLFLLVIPFIMAGCNRQKPAESPQSPPGWASGLIWYQIFVERFNNGDPTNDPTLADISTPTQSFEAPADWKVTPWNGDWYEIDPWMKKSGKDLSETLQHRRYGGDLQGIFDKLDYLEELGITAVYFNPVNYAPSLHKYDARSYHHIDVNFGPNPEGDKKLIAAEDPGDPKTWVWTAADRMMLDLIAEFHRRNIRVIFDFSWNHTGVLFPQFQDVVQKQESSVYKNWYDIIQFNDPATPENEFKYKGWLDIASLPEIRKTDVKNRVHGKPYEGNMDPDATRHIQQVTSRWLAPDGDPAKGIDGIRLDVAEQIPMGFWKDYRAYCNSVKPDVYLVGEIWWEKWPDVMMDPTPYINTGYFDAVMFYQLYEPARRYFTGQLTAAKLAEALNKQWDRLPHPNIFVSMNVNATHDAPRLLSDFANPGKYKYNASVFADSSYMGTQPDAEVYERVKLYLLHQFTIPGSPHMWNGDEMGMWGGDDPDCRKPLWWEGIIIAPENSNIAKTREKRPAISQPAFNREHFEYYRMLTSLRKAHPALTYGEIKFLPNRDGLLVYERTYKGKSILMAFNMTGKTVKFDIPYSSYTNLLAGRPSGEKQILLKPVSAVILRKS